MQAINLKHIVVSLLVVLGFQSLTQAQTAPPMINYQGRLTQSTGVVVPDGLTGMRVRIFATASGGTALWDSGDLTVATKSGTFSILLGSGGMLPISPLVFALGTVYIEVQPAGQQAPLMPRQPIASVPWAFWAQTVSDGAITTLKLAANSVTASRLATDPGSLGKMTNGYLYQDPGYPKIAMGGASALLRLEGTSLANIEWDRGGSGLESFILGQRSDLGGNNSDLKFQRLHLGYFSGIPLQIQATTGNVGINNSNPQYSLDVNGTLRAQSSTGPILGVESSGMEGGVHGSGAFYGVVGDGGPGEEGQFGVYGRIARPNDGGGVLGQATTTTGTSVGGYFVSNSPNGRAIWATNGGFGGTAIFGQSAGGGFGGYFVGKLYASDRVGIGVTTPDSMLDVSGNAHFRGDVAINGSTTLYAIQSFGDFSTTDSTPTKSGPGDTWTVASDARLKKNVAPLDDSLSKLLSLRGVSYEYRDPKRGAGRYPGFIAQDVQKVFPDWVTVGPDGYLRVGPIGFEASAVEAMRELEARITTQHRENAELRRESDRLRSKVAELAEHNKDLTERIGRVERQLNQLSSAVPTRKNVK